MSDELQQFPRWRFVAGDRKGSPLQIYCLEAVEASPRLMVSLAGDRLFPYGELLDELTV